MDTYETPKYCARCGAALLGAGKFCVKCGMPAVAPAAPREPVGDGGSTQKWNPEETQQWDMGATQMWTPPEEPWGQEAVAQWDENATQQIPVQPAYESQQWQRPEQPQWEEPAEPVAWNATVAKTTIAEKKAAGKPPKDKKMIALIISICSMILAFGLLLGVILLQSCDNDSDDRDDDRKSGSSQDKNSEKETDETEETDETRETNREETIQDTRPTDETQENTEPTTEPTLPPLKLEELVNQRQWTFDDVGGVWHLCIAEDEDLSRITWSTSDPAVATVDATGTVTAVGKGEAVITATYEDQIVECVITVQGGMSYAEYMAAEVDTEVTVDCYVQATQEWYSDTISIYAQDQDGGYFIYNALCTEEKAARLTAGTKIRVTGYKAEFAGLVEIMDATVEILDVAQTWTAEPLDVTAMTDAELEAYMNKKVVFTDVTIEKIEYKNGQPGDDIYITVNDNGMTRNFCVEVHLTGTDSDVYQTVSTLTEGNVVDIVGFLYWYEGPEPHITAITVK